MFEINVLGATPVSFENLNRMSKVIHIDVINEVRRLCFGSALLPALFFF